MIYESSFIDTPKQNELAERKNGHLLSVTQALLFEKQQHKSYWGEVVLIVAHFIN